MRCWHQDLLFMPKCRDSRVLNTVVLTGIPVQSWVNSALPEMQSFGWEVNPRPLSGSAKNSMALLSHKIIVAQKESLWENKEKKQWFHHWKALFHTENRLASWYHFADVRICDSIRWWRSFIIKNGNTSTLNRLLNPLPYSTAGCNIKEIWWHSWEKSNIDICQWFGQQ